MQSYRINSHKDIELVEEITELGDNQVKIKISKAMIGATDLNSYNGNSQIYPIIPCHCAIGLISSADEKLGLNLGERVILSPYIAGTDSIDKRVELQSSIDIMGVNCDGFLRDYIIMNKENIYLLPESIKDNEAIFIENIAVAVKALSTLGLQKGEYVVIIGANSIGNILAQLAIYYQAVPILIDTDDYKLALAEDCGIYYTINPTEIDTPKRIMEITGGKMADYTIYDSHNILPINGATIYTKYHGSIGVVGYNGIADNNTIRLQGLLSKQLTLIGINNGYLEIPTAINLLAQKAIRTDMFISKVAKFEDVPEILNEMSEYPYKYYKVVIDCL